MFETRRARRHVARPRAVIKGLVKKKVTGRRTTRRRSIIWNHDETSKLILCPFAPFPRRGFHGQRESKSGGDRDDGTLTRSERTIDVSQCAACHSTQRLSSTFLVRSEKRYWRVESVEVNSWKSYSRMPKNATPITQMVYAYSQKMKS